MLFRVLSILVAAGLIWLTLRRTDWAEFAVVLRTADYRWLVALLPITLASHGLRAWRWRLLLGTLRSAPKKRLPMGDLFAAVMIGYMINYAIPRAGELVRSTHLARRRQMSVSGVLGTVISERLIDVVFLAIGIVACAIYLGSRAGIFWEKMTADVYGSFETLAYTDLSLLIGLTVLVPAICWRLEVVQRLLQKIRPALSAFTEGMATGLRVKSPLLMWTSTLAMWLLYGVMAYLPLWMFDLAGTHSLDYVDGLIIMFVGAVGVLVPTPGGAGSFHYITVLLLTAVYSMASGPATAYAVFIHGYQLILYLAVGLVMIAWKGGLGKAETEEG